MNPADDPRIQMARALARAGTTHGSANSIGKALILVVDWITEPDPSKSEIGRDAIEGRVPPVIG